MGKVKKFRIFLYIQLLLWFSFFFILVHAGVSIHLSGEGLEMKREIVRIFGLTDLCLTTEARYTRHPSQADYFTPFQDNPLALEFFPSGGAMSPPKFDGIPTEIVIEDGAPKT